HVQDDVADVAEKSKPRTVGGEVNIFARVGSIEKQGVVSRSALNEVAAVTGIPLERVIAFAKINDVISLVPIYEIVARTAHDQIGRRAADQGVVAGVAKEVRGWWQTISNSDVIVAGESQDLNERSVGDIRHAAADRH